MGYAPMPSLEQEAHRLLHRRRIPCSSYARSFDSLDFATANLGDIRCLAFDFNEMQRPFPRDHWTKDSKERR